MYHWVKLRPQNGESCRFWTDHWSPFGSLVGYLKDTNSNLGVRQNATLADIYNQGQWILPSARSENQVSLQVYLTTVQLNEEDDRYEWEIEGQVTKTYSIGQVYRLLRGEEAEVPWHKAVWIKGGIPRHGFLTWLFVLNRCPTRDRIINWGLQTDPACLLCNRFPESRDHIYFECDYSFAIWTHLAMRCNTLAQRPWEETTTQMQNLPPNNTKSRLILLSWQATVYWVWNERNGRLHRRNYRPWETIKQLIERQIKERILSYRVAQPKLASKLMQEWLRSVTAPAPIDHSVTASSSSPNN